MLLGCVSFTTPENERRKVHLRMVSPPPLEKEIPFFGNQHFEVPWVVFGGVCFICLFIDRMYNIRLTVSSMIIFSYVEESQETFLAKTP